MTADVVDVADRSRATRCPLALTPGLERIELKGESDRQQGRGREGRMGGEVVEAVGHEFLTALGLQCFLPGCFRPAASREHATITACSWNL